MKRSIMVLWIFLLIGSLVATPRPVKADENALNKSTYWIKTYGGSGDERATAIAVAPNGDIIVAGYTDSFGAGKDDVWVLRLDSEGKVKWQRTYGGSDYDMAYAVAIAENGDIIVAGTTRSFGVGRYDFWILRLDPDGNIKWQKTYGGSDEDAAYAVAIAPNGDIIVAGYTESFGAGGEDVWVLRLDEKGNVKWQKTYGGNNDDRAYAIAIAENGDIIVAGYTNSFWVRNTDVWVLRLDENGTILWQKTYGSWCTEGARGVTIASNGDVIVAGYIGESGSDVWILRLDENGSMKWQKIYGRRDYLEGASAVAIAPNGDIIVAGAVFMRLSPDGWLKWAKKIRGDDIKVLPDGTSVLVGTVRTSRLWDFQVARFNIDDVPSYSGWRGWWGWDDVSIGKRNYNTDLEIHVTNAQVKTSSAKIHSTEAQIRDTDTQMKTLWAMGTLKISSEPSGAKVYVEGNYKGKTPIILNLPPGTHEIEIIKEGYKKYTTKVALNPEEKKALSVTLTPAYGFLTVYSSPSNAEVYIDGNYVGDTPLENYKLSTGEHIIKIKKEGYQDYNKTITINPAEIMKLEVTLSEKPGTLKISSEPSGAKVYINGDYKGETPLTLELEPGTYTVKLTKEDYENYTLTIEVKAGETKEITAQLRKNSATTTPIAISTATTTTTTTATTTPVTTTTPTKNSGKSGDSGICGPALMIGLALLPILTRKRRA